MEKKGESKEQPKTTTYKAFSVDLNAPCSHNLLTVESAQKYLQSSFKVNGLRMRETNPEGKKGKSDKGDNRPIKVSATEKSDKRKNTLIIQVDNKLKFSKRYIKYLVKKFLRKEGISKYLTVSATSPNGYTVKVIKKNEE